MNSPTNYIGLDGLKIYNDSNYFCLETSSSAFYKSEKSLGSYENTVEGLFSYCSLS